MTRVRRRPTPCVIGIDQSLSGFAICVLYANGTHRMYRQGFPPEKYTGIDRLAAIGIWVRQVLSEIDNVTHICMEGYARERRNGREEAGELSAIVRMAIRTDGFLQSPVCYPTIVTPGGLKKFVTGSGKGAKSDIKMFVLKKWGLTLTNDNEADAYGLARIAAAIQWQKDELFEYQKDVLKALRHHTELKE